MIDGFTEEKLREHNESVQKLARWLVTSGEDPDDLAQETLLTTLLHPPRDAAALSSWTRRVLVNRLSRTRRTENRRRRRERKYAGVKRNPEPFDVLAVEQLRQDVLNAILGLPAPQRDAIFDLFYNDLSRREIAKRRGLSVETVKSRVRLALRALRKALDARYGSRETWALTIVPLAGFAGLREAIRAMPGGKAAPGLFTLPIGLGAAAVILTLALALLLRWGGLGGGLPGGIALPGPPAARGAPADAPAAGGETAAGAPRDADGTARTPPAIAALPERAGDPVATAAAGPIRALARAVRIRGEVVDSEANPVSGAELRLSDGTSDAVKNVTSTQVGSFVIAGVPTGTWVIECRAPGYVPEERRLVADGSRAEIETSFRLERARETRVRIETPGGESLARAHARSVEGSDPRRRPFDYLDPSHFGVVATDRDWDASLPSLDGVVRRFPGGEYKHQPGAGEYCGTLVTEVARDVRVRLYYRHVPLAVHDRFYADGVPAEITFRVAPETELRPLLARLAVRVLDETTGKPLPAFVQLRGRYETPGVDSGVPTSADDGAVAFTDRVPGLAIVEISAAGPELPPGARWATKRLACLPPGGEAPPITVALGPPRQVAVRCVGPDRAALAAGLQRSRLHEDFPRPFDLSDETSYYLADGVCGLIFREANAAMLLTATVSPETGLAATPAVFDGRNLPAELTFTFVPASRWTFRFAQERTRCQLVMLLTSDGVPAWSREVDGPCALTAAVVPGEYTLRLFLRDAMGAPAEIESRPLRCEIRENALEFP